MTDSNPAEKFGTAKGVLIPNITMMFGVILFLRLGVLTAHSGPWQMLSAIALSLTIMTLTSFSIGSLVTNMDVGTGGVYYIISRTLGIEIGGAIGVAIYFAQLISTCLTVGGFSISICELYPQLPLAAVEIATLTVLTIISGYSASWALSLQGGILALLLAGIASVLLGSPENLEGLTVSATPFYKGGSLEFWQSFAMFYPAMTGIEAGMALSGSLRNPGRSLYRGNLYSLLAVAACYATLVIFAAWRIPHDVLLTDPFAFVEFARWPALVHVSIWGATLSSALGCLLGAPRMLQSMALDGIMSEKVGETSGAQDQPRTALFITYVATAILLLLTTIDQIIPMLAMICLVSYGMLNLVTACAALMNSPSWRPQLQTHWLSSLAGLTLIVIAMFMTAPGWALITMLVLAIGYLALRARQLETGFQDLRESLLFFISRLALYRLGQPTEHALTWHPQLLVLGCTPPQQEKLLRLAHSLTRRSGILTFASVVPEEWQSHDRLQSTRAALQSQFEQREIACMAEVYPAANTYDGYMQLIRAYGIGPIQPNTAVLEIDESNIGPELVDLIETCSCMGKNILLLAYTNSCPDQLFQTRGPRKKTIDVCWNPDDSTHFDLTMSLVTTLTDGLVFGDANITIKAEVNDIHATEPVTDYLRTYCEKSRIKARLVVSAEKIVSPKAGQLSFVSLKPLEAEASPEDKAAYESYLKQSYLDNADKQVVAFVTSYDHVDHRAIYFSSSDTDTAN